MGAHWAGQQPRPPNAAPGCLAAAPHLLQEGDALGADHVDDEALRQDTHLQGGFPWYHVHVRVHACVCKGDTSAAPSAPVQHMQLGRMGIALGQEQSSFV